MAPLPCSPVSNSTASESQSQTHSDDTDDSLTTPRPGPADPAQRTAANLSTPLPVFGSPESPRSPWKAAAPTSAQKDSQHETQTEGHPRNPYTYGSSPKTQTRAESLGSEASDRPQPPERQRSVSFSPSSHPKTDRHGSSYSSYLMNRRLSPNVSPHGGPRVSEDNDHTESSADENTAIFRRRSNNALNSYGAVQEEDNDGHVGGYDGAAEEPDGNVSPSARRRKGSLVKGRVGGRAGAGAARGADATQDGEEENSESESWFKKLVDKYGSVELENKGSVARDHLALERTFLAWLRTSLSFASIGIAVTQLFRLNTSLTNNNGSTESVAPDTSSLRQVGKPLGATFLGISILILLLGFHRYFESQHYVIRGKFPASRGSIVIVSFVAGALIVASLVVVVAVAPTAFERK